MTDNLPLKRFKFRYHELHTVLLEAVTMADAAKQAEDIMKRIAPDSFMLDIRVIPEDRVA